ncbi:MAG: hypothetical protein J6S29_07565, partial [Methanosphaera sp.]|nr:hypothetical protein [Methanosphaera sp.]
EPEAAAEPAGPSFTQQLRQQNKIQTGTLEQTETPKAEEKAAEPVKEEAKEEAPAESTGEVKTFIDLIRSEKLL